MGQNGFKLGRQSLPARSHESVYPGDRMQLAKYQMLDLSRLILAR